MATWLTSSYDFIVPRKVDHVATEQLKSLHGLKDLTPD